MSVVNNNLLLAAEDGGGYVIARSLRFRSSASAYLNRTPASAGNRRTWTWSGWVKRGDLSATYSTLFGAGPNGNNTDAILFTNNTLNIWSYTSGSPAVELATSAVYRDPSAWYHVVVQVDTTQATSTNRVRLYVNGNQLTLSGTQPTLNFDFPNINNNLAQALGSYTGPAAAGPLDGYLTEVNFVDGQALTPDSFGEYNEDTGVWQPKKFAGTYGTNGFYLNFSDPTSTTTLTADKSGNGNNWTANNISLTSGATYDSMIDTPTPVADVRGNFAVLNPLNGGLGSFLSAANLQMGAPVANAWYTISATLPNTGKKYMELTALTGGATRYLAVGVSRQANGILSYIGSTADSYSYINSSQKYNNGVAASYAATWTDGDVIGVAFDADALTLEFFKNGVSQGVAYTVTAGEYFFGVSTYNYNASVNFGQCPFAYTPPSGFKALHTGNLPEPAIVDGGTQFNAVAYTGTGTSNNSVTGVGFRPDLVWIKSRSYAGSHVLQDAVRPSYARLVPNLNLAENTDTQLDWFKSFNTDGFTVSTSSTAGILTDEWNGSGQSFVAWNWKANGAGVTNTAGSITSTVSANPTAGFSIVTYTGTGVVATVGHGLGVAPKMIIIKVRNAVNSWLVYTTVIDGSNDALFLNLTDAAVNAAEPVPTSTVFTQGGGTLAGANGSTYVAYCFAEVPGYSRFGSYTGNGSADGTFVFTGFRPRYVLVKASTTGGFSWVIHDTARSDRNLADQRLIADGFSAEFGNDGLGIDILSNGFKIRTTNGNWNAASIGYVYMAFAEHPFKYALAR